MLALIIVYAVILGIGVAVLVRIVIRDTKQIQLQRLLSARGAREAASWRRAMRVLDDDGRRVWENKVRHQQDAQDSHVRCGRRAPNKRRASARKQGRQYDLSCWWE